jgi:hypothetical protein
MLVRPSEKYAKNRLELDHPLKASGVRLLNSSSAMRQKFIHPTLGKWSFQFGETSRPSLTQLLLSPHEFAGTLSDD